MTEPDSTPQDNDGDNEGSVDRRRDEALRRALTTPPTPRKPTPKTARKAPGPNIHEGKK
jgi:hypothetical protein